MSLWNLTPRQIEVMDCLVETGCNKLVARDLGMQVRTVERHMNDIYKKARTNRLMTVLMWDRFKRGGEHGQGCGD